MDLILVGGAVVPGCGCRTRNGSREEVARIDRGRVTSLRGGVLGGTMVAVKNSVTRFRSHRAVANAHTWSDQWLQLSDRSHGSSAGIRAGQAPSAEGRQE